jgi:mono/diheme cytochrome c family protein
VNPFAKHRFTSRSALMLPAALCGLSGQLASAGGIPYDFSVARGEHIARIVCSACHVVATDQEYPPILKKPAPDFREIANRPGTSAESLQHFIMNTHWDVDSLPMTMPNPMLGKDEAGAVSRYILRLRRH